MVYHTGHNTTGRELLDMADTGGSGEGEGVGKVEGVKGYWRR